MGVRQGNTGANQKISQWPKLKQFEKQKNTVVMDYNPKYKIDTRESTLI